jgi:hypothetical protein
LTHKKLKYQQARDAPIYMLVDAAQTIINNVFNSPEKLWEDPEKKNEMLRDLLKQILELKLYYNQCMQEVIKRQKSHIRFPLLFITRNNLPSYGPNNHNGYNYRDDNEEKLTQETEDLYKCLTRIKR